MTTVGDNISFIYRSLCRNLDVAPRVVRRGLATKELFDVHLQLCVPRERFVNSKYRAMSMRYFVGELCHYLDGRRDLASIAHYGKFWRDVSDDGKTINSAYGHRLFEHSNAAGLTQFSWAMRSLVEDPNTNKAVMVIYHPNDSRPSRDNPCTLSAQLIIRENFLHMIVNMRSQDIWLGLPYDVAFFTVVHEAAFQVLRRDMLQLKLGTYFHNVISLHVYERDWSNIRAIMMESDHKPVRAPQMCVDDVRTWFNDLLTFEKASRGRVLYKSASVKTPFQEWCKQWIG